MKIVVQLNVGADKYHIYLYDSIKGVIVKSIAKGKTKKELLDKVDRLIERYKEEYFMYSIVRDLQYLYTIIKTTKRKVFIFSMEW